MGEGTIINEILKKRCSVLSGSTNTRKEKPKLEMVGMLRTLH